MSTVQNTSALSAFMNATQASSTGATSGNTASDIQNRFLSMLVAQMKNQDPLNPLDNAQVTSQMAQLSTVQGITDLNTSMQALADSLGAGQMAQAANLIGHGVLVPGNNVAPSAGYNVIGMNLPNSADQVKVAIQDATGQTVRTMNLGSQSYGDHLFTWDGLTDNGSQAANGVYQFSVSAVQGGNAMDATTLSVGQVNGVLRNGTDIQLQVDSVGAVKYADVRQIL
jgi:flagellar basal-body rod modification protein FlgD